MERFQAEMGEVADRLLRDEQGTWKIDGQPWDWVQAFRVENGKLVEAWLSGINFDGQWTPDVLH